jgi:hypothetical protein
MLTALTTGLRFRFAITLAAFAAFCFLVPPAMAAFGHGENTVDCLAHADTVGHGATHDHGGKPDGDGQAGHQANCCGLFCMSALAADTEPTVGCIDAGTASFAAIEARLSSRVPEQPDRPPITNPIV